MKKIVLLLIVAALGIQAYAADLVIGTWEDNSGDGWQGWTTDSNSIGPLPKTLGTGVSYAQSTIGHTDGSSSLQVSGVTSNIQCLAIKMNAAQRANFMTNTTFSIDYTVAAGTTGGWNEIYNISLNADGYSWTDQFETSPAAHFDFWPGSSQRKTTVSFNYEAAKAGMPANPSYVEIILSLNSGSGSDSHEFYFDNAILTPEPATIALLGLGLALLRKRS